MADDSKFIMNSLFLDFTGFLKAFFIGKLNRHLCLSGIPLEKGCADGFLCKFWQCSDE